MPKTYTPRERVALRWLGVLLVAVSATVVMAFRHDTVAVVAGVVVLFVGLSMVRLGSGRRQ